MKDEQNTNNQSPKPSPTKFIVPVLLVLLVSGVVFGLLGYYLGRQYPQVQRCSDQYRSIPENNTPTVTPTPTPTAPIISPTPKPGFKVYTSSFERLSFQYPTDWQLVEPKLESNIPNADAVDIKSPSGKLTLSWMAAITGLGGGCDSEAPLKSGRGCPLLEVIEKQKVPNTDLYYVAYIVTNGTFFHPSLALQDNNGILKTSRDMGYLLFKGKNNSGESAGLISGRIPYGRNVQAYESREDALSFFSTLEAEQAKDILLSVTY